ncbi:MAG: hypothetical protein HY721_13770 [Planctomycetes bacterium]|nr:hypothetical protein [Planctomycetota bacterium]
MGSMACDASRIAKARRDILEVHASLGNLVAADEAAFLEDERNSLAVKYLFIEAVGTGSSTTRSCIG